jgi:hypothetical protein
MMNTSLTYDDLAEAAALMADRLLAAQNENCALNLELAVAQGEVAALRGALEFEQERARALRNRGDHWQIVATEAPPRTCPGRPQPLRSPSSTSCAAPSRRTPARSSAAVAFEPIDLQHGPWFIRGGLDPSASDCVAQR